MADRNQSNEQSNAKSAPAAQRDQPTAERDETAEPNVLPAPEKSTASRPRGQTEDPDRTL